MKEQYIKKIANKIINNIDDITVEEARIISRRAELTNILLQEVVKQKKPEVLVKCDENIGEALLRNKEVCALYVGFAAASSLKSLQSGFATMAPMLLLNPEDIEMCRKYYEYYMDFSNFIYASNGPDEEDIFFLLDTGRYDLFDKINKVPSKPISAAAYNRFTKEYPEATKSFVFITDYLFNNGLTDNLTIKELIDYYNSLTLFKSGHSTIKDKCFRIIMEKMTQYDGTGKLELDIAWPNDRDTIDRTYENGIVNLYNSGYIASVPVLALDNSVDNDQLKQELLRLIKSKKASREYLKSIFLVTDNYSSLDQEDEIFSIQNDGEIIKCLVDNDYLDVVFSTFYITAIENNLEIINNAIINGLSTTFIECLGGFLDKVPAEVLQLLVRHKLISQVSGVKMSSEIFNEKQVMYLLDNGIKIKPLFGAESPIGYVLERYLIEREEWELIREYNLLRPRKENIERIAKGIKTDIAFAVNIVSTYPRFIIEHQELLDAVINSLDEIIEMLLDELNHDEGLEDLYSHDLFNKLKQFFCRKYNYDIEKLELLERHCGPTITRYIDNENISEILKLPKEMIEKILALFTNKEYTMGDLRAAYDSLVQYAFAQKRPVEQSLFATLKQAAQRQDIESINECRQKMLNTIDNESFGRIRRKYNIQLPTLPEYFDYLVSQLLSGVDEEGNLNKLKEIANEYVALERKRYHNYHFFDKLNGDFANLYETIVEAIDKNDQEKIGTIYNKQLKKYLNKAFYKALSKRFGEQEYNPNPEVLMRTLFDGIATPGKRTESLIFLKFVTDYVCERKKDEDSKNIEFGEELKLPYYLDERSLERAVEKEIIFGSSYCIQEEDRERTIIEIIAEKLASEYRGPYKSNHEQFVSRAISQEFFLNGFFKIIKGELSPQNALYHYGSGYYNSLVTDFNNIKRSLIESGEIPAEYYDIYVPEIEKLKNTRLKSTNITFYDYLEKHMPIYLRVCVHSDNAEETFANEVKWLIPRIIKYGREIIKSHKVLSRANGEFLDINEEIIKKYYVNRRDLYLDKDGKYVPLALEIYKQIKMVPGETDDLDRAQIILLNHSYSLSKEEMDHIYKIIKDLSSKYRVVYSRKADNILYSSVISSVDKRREVTRVYIPEETDMNPYEILANLDLNLLIKNVLKNDEMYAKLLKVAQEKKVCSLPPTLNRLLESLGVDLSIDASDIAAFISNFPSVLEAIKETYRRAGKEIPEEIPFTLSTIVTEAVSFGAASSVYAQILGKEDARLIKSNPKPNSAIYKLAKNARLNEAVELTPGCFTRMWVTVPTFSETFETSSKKRLKAICGNFTSPCNMTHGERTGACMKIGGVGESLFYFALQNENGFHIRFEDPDTGEYVSRVTGFRNGNTVFLNELRESCIDKYDNQDVFDACKQAAERLIELSKNSSCPIENVVIENSYALFGRNMKEVDLNINNVKEGLGDFYSDVKSPAVVLATTANEGFTPINLDKSRVPRYPVQRGEIKHIVDAPKMIGKINRVISVKALIEGKPLAEIESYKMNDGFIEGYASDDWFAYINEKKEIKYCSINIDSRAKDELEECLSSLRKSLGEETETYAI